MATNLQLIAPNNKFFKNRINNKIAIKKQPSNHQLITNFQFNDNQITIKLQFIYNSIATKKKPFKRQLATKMHLKCT